MNRTRLLVVLALASVASAVGCKKKEAAPTVAPPAPSAPVNPARASTVRVTEVQLGNALGDDKRVKVPSTAFGKTDTVFASVVTEGSAPTAELSARWTYQDGQVVNETKRAIAPNAAAGAVAVTEFSIQKPDGWPAGDYKVEISLDGKPVES
jgi:hypothetical protein